MPFEPNDLLNMYGQFDQDALRALADQAAQSGGVMLGGGSYFQSPQGATFIPDIQSGEMSYCSLYGCYTDYDTIGAGTVPSGDHYTVYWGSGYGNTSEYRETEDEFPERITIQATGLYVFGAAVLWDDAATGSSFGHHLRISGSLGATSPLVHFEDSRSTSSPGAAFLGTYQSLSGMLRMASGCYLQVSVAHNYGSDLLLSQASHCAFWIGRISIAESPEFPAVIDGGSQ